MLGLFYDVFKILRILLPVKSIVIFIQDIIYFLLASFATYLFILTFNAGEIRGFIIIGEGCGFLVHYLLFSPYVIKSAQTIIFTVKRILTFLFRIIFAPFKFLFKIISKPFLWLFRLLQGKLKIFWDFLKNILRRSGGLLYNHSKHKNEVVSSDPEEEFYR